MREMMEEVANINIFEGSVTESETENIVVAGQDSGKVAIILPNGKKIWGDNFRDNQKKLFQYLLSNQEYRSLIEEYIADGKATFGHCLGTEPNYLPNGQAYTVKLKEGVFLFVHYSTANRRKAIQKFADSVGLKLDILWD
ncbi:hypothetical protein [Neisseria perflava]|uniref:hypothetical protein n=1 Tax=Neisseria perflava TaxID=33053 RepID=UPI0020A23373|nr:hypothetical protein [Neisseria perflava]MCP1659761.1 hypothetical protein [Neisseria perflava]MCP1771640.1 hypothetical protein [Neisseria perflava]